MPSQYYSHPLPPPLPHLSDIIKLKPEGDHRCLGFAYTQGRRCLNHTNARDRKTAVSLLYKGTRDLHQGHHIDDLLEDLAPLVLCRRWHQNQAAEFVETWQRRVHRFERSYNTPALAAPSQSPRTTTSTSTSASASARRSSSGQQEFGVEHLERRLHDMRVGFELSYNTLAPVVSSQPPRTTTSTSTSTSASSRRSSSGQQEPGVEHLERRLHDMRVELERLRASVSRTQPTVQNLSSTSNGQARAPSASVRPADVAGASDGSARSRRTSSTRSSDSTVSSPVTLSSVPISPASTSLTSPLDGTPRHVRRTAGITLPSSRAGDATRRPIEGECGICLNLLRRTRSRAGSSSGDEVVGVDTAEDTDSGYEEESEEETGADEGLTWCRAQCGVNYHAECIGQWLQESRHRNCPTCRSGWIE
ncbi:uncharacterized protein APUU_50696S [Aspergillus puulaauensis]|uniref:RING-type domain-containing protein n=1 Tax=Aspergillus puulaauensis TaxID=1220207 RepID=A0A7R7XQX0_9EURO|nr:uncharacterized protein APUU_50696S [Aspergillus puulaauensis]BCS25985.1 hypothetical protein APUU_50696S [Aspergillus puulaauensis]